MCWEVVIIELIIQQDCCLLLSLGRHEILPAMYVVKMFYEAFTMLTASISFRSLKGFNIGKNPIFRVCFDKVLNESSTLRYIKT